VRDERGGIRAFGIALRQRDQLAVGPLVARDASEAIVLFRALSGGHAGAVRLDVPAPQEAFLSALAGLGLARSRRRRSCCGAPTSCPGGASRFTRSPRAASDSSFVETPADAWTR